MNLGTHKRAMYAQIEQGIKAAKRKAAASKARKAKSNTTKKQSEADNEIIRAYLKRVPKAPNFEVRDDE